MNQLLQKLFTKFQRFTKPNLVALTKQELNMLLGIFLRMPEIEKVVMYGSRARGNHKPYSDVDMAIFGKDVTSSTAATLKGYIEDDTTFPYFVDVCAYSQDLPQNLKDSIDKDGICIFKK